MAETHGLLIYERLMSFAEYRKENGNEMQQAVYSDLVDYLSGISPDNDREALQSVMRITYELTELYVAGEREIEKAGWRNEYIDELKEIYAIIALTKPREFEQEAERIVNNTDTFPIMSVEVGFKNDPDLFFRAEMWRDELIMLQTMLSTKEDREGTDFKVINLSDGGMLTIDLNEVLFVNCSPYVEDENTTIEMEFVDDDYFDEEL